MSKFLPLITALFLTATAQSEVVLWKATGALTTGTGVFQRQDLSPDDPVTLRITYDDQATQQVLATVFGRVESAYRTEVSLKVIITAGTYTWEGFVDSATTTDPTTFHTFTFSYASPEKVKFTVSSTDNATFPTFPYRLAESTSSIFLDFQGTNNTFLDSGISELDIHSEALSSATGKISTGVGNDLSFTIDPASLEVLKEANEVVPPSAPEPSIEAASDSISLSWQSDFRFRYRVESTNDLSAATWDAVETRNGTDAVITRSYPVADPSLFYRIVALERPPLE